MFQIPAAFIGPCGCRLQDNGYRSFDEWFKDGYWVRKGQKARGIYNGAAHFCRCQVKPKPQKSNFCVTNEMYQERSRGLTTYSRRGKFEYFR